MRVLNRSGQAVHHFTVLDREGNLVQSQIFNLAAGQDAHIGLPAGAYLLEAYAENAPVPAATLQDVPSDALVRFNEADLIIIGLDDTGDPQQEVGP
jgi:hypothetical protein